MEISEIYKMLLIYFRVLFVHVLVELLGNQIHAGVPEFTFCCSHKTYFMDDNLCIGFFFF